MRLMISLTFILALVCSAPAAAQDVSGGFKAGVAFSRLVFDEEIIEVSLDTRTGVAAGAFITWPVSRRFDIQTEALFIQKGSAFDEFGVEGAIKLTYLEIPVLFRLRGATSPNTAIVLYAGPVPAFRLSARTRGEFLGQSEEEDISDDIEALDFGLAFGAGVESGALTLEARYTGGLMNINKSFEDEDVTARNRAFAILVGIRF